MVNGEDKLISRMRDLLPVGNRTLVWSGDDCAEISTPEGRVLVTTDVLVEGRHFRTDWSSPSEVGQRCAQQNLADIAGQGAVASALVVSLVIPDAMHPDWVIDLVSGFGAAVKPTGAGVVGGDISRGKELSISVAALGYAPYGSVLRSGARPGDVIAIAGTLGFSAAGYDLLDTGVVDPSFHSEESLGQWFLPVSTFRVPKPLLSAGPKGAEAGAHAMMDVSDGLSTDLSRMATASNVDMHLHTDKMTAEVDKLTKAAQITGSDPWQWVLHGGEDHAILATFPAKQLVPQPFRVIGSVGECASRGKPDVFLDGVKLFNAGWDHFTDFIN